MERLGWRIIVWLAAMGLMLAACSGTQATETFSEVGSGLGGSSGSDGVGAADLRSQGDGEQEPEAQGVEDTNGDLGTGGVVLAAFRPADYGRDIIFTADLTVAVGDVAAAGAEATRIVESVGGFLFGQQTLGAPEPRSVLTFKVPPEAFQEALNRLGAVGEVRSQTVSAGDVTDRIVDLESRIQTAETSVERLRALLLEATEVKSIVELENELLARETELESLRGQLRTLEDQVALATIVVTVSEAATMPAIDLTVTAYPAHDDGVSCPGDGGLSIEEGAEATICFEITNAGDTWLAGLDLRDPVLDVETGDLISVFGELEVPLEPGASVMVAAEITPERSLRTQTTVTGEPVDQAGASLPGRPASTVSSLYVDAVDPGGVPTFAEGVQASWDLLVRLGEILVLLAGAMLPFIWLPVVGVVVWRYRRGKRDGGIAPSPSAD